MSNEEEKAPEEESTATFEPVVRLEEVETTTGEEDETVEYSHRCKVYEFAETMLDAGTGNKTWVERGVGDIKILKHKEDGKIRVLMRQDKTMKIKINHVLMPDYKLTENAGSDRSWVWTAQDFAQDELKESLFAVKFKDAEIAAGFKEAFEANQKVMADLLGGADGQDADGEAADAADALANLNVANNEDDEDTDDDV